MKEEKPRTALNVALTAEGLRACGLPAGGAAYVSVGVSGWHGLSRTGRGFSATRSESAPESGRSAGRATDPVHAMLFLFAADEAALDETVSCAARHPRQPAAGVGELPGSMQQGYRPDTSTEPFGFHDGIAQPSIAGLAGQGVPTGEFILGYENHYGLIPPTPVVPRALDPGRHVTAADEPVPRRARISAISGDTDPTWSYRKLQQDVAGFWQFMSREAARDGSEWTLRAWSGSHRSASDAGRPVHR